jgi:tRNA(fMet)-specific endonuclease VapC
MILLDTDHLTVISYPADSRYQRLSERVRGAGARGHEFATTVISLEEQMRGWLGAIAKTRDLSGQIALYSRLTALVEFFQGWEIVPWDVAAVHEFERARKHRVRTGTQDLKIASIALSRDALLLSANCPPTFETSARFPA